MIKKVLGDQLGRNISAYVDDVVVRSKKRVTFRIFEKCLQIFAGTA